MSIGKQALFKERREVLGPTKPYSLSWLRVRTRELEEMLDVGIGPEVNEQIDDCIAALETPGPFTAYVHDDPCPDKGLWMDGQIKLLNFESGAYRHALIDGTYGRILFPSCWCVNQIPGHIPLRMEDEYRNRRRRAVSSGRSVRLREGRDRQLVARADGARQRMGHRHLSTTRIVALLSLCADD